MLTPIEFVAVAFDPATQTPLLVLRETGGHTTVSFSVTHADANTVAAQAMGVTPLRPHAVDCIKALLERFGADITKIVIDIQGESSVTARLYLRLPSRTEIIECCPPDAIALALRCSAPLFATTRVLESSASRDQTAPKDRLRDSIAKLDTVEFGKYCLE